MTDTIGNRGYNNGMGKEKIMSVSESQAKIKERIWKAIAQSELDLSALPTETTESLVELVAEAALVEADAILEAEAPEPAVSEEEKADDDEETLWRGRPFLSISKDYQVTNQRIRITEGVLGKKRTDIELVKIQDINQTQKFSERLINVGDLTIRSNDKSNPLVILDNVTNVQDVHEILRKAMLEARERANFSYREEM